MKGYNSGTARWKRCIGEGVEKGLGASMPSPGITLHHLHVLTNLEATETLSFWVFVEASLHKHDWLNH